MGGASAPDIVSLLCAHKRGHPELLAIDIEFARNASHWAINDALMRVRFTAARGAIAGDRGLKNKFPPHPVGPFAGRVSFLGRVRLVWNHRIGGARLRACIRPLQSPCGC